MQYCTRVHATTDHIDQHGNQRDDAEYSSWTQLLLRDFNPAASRRCPRFENVRAAVWRRYEGYRHQRCQGIGGAQQTDDCVFPPCAALYGSLLGGFVTIIVIVVGSISVLVVVV